MTLRDEVIYKLRTLPEEKFELETKYYDALNSLKEAKQDLSNKECKVYSDGKIKDKNELTRRADLFKFTESLQREVLKKEIAADIAKANLNKIRAEFDAYIMIGKLIVNQQDEKKTIKINLAK